MVLSATEKTRLDRISTRVVKVSPRSKREKIQIYVSNELNAYWTSIEQMVDEVTGASEGLPSWTIDLETVYEYGEERAKLCLSGYRDATEEEAEYLRERISRQEEERQAHRAAYEEDQIKLLRASRPELFK